MDEKNGCQDLYDISDEDKLKLLHPYLEKYGDSSMSYASLQNGMRYFLIQDVGYISYVQIRHLFFAPRGMSFILGNPECDKINYKFMLALFLKKFHHVAVVPVDEDCATLLRGMNFKANCVGYDPVISIQDYKTEGDWNNFENIRRARNELRKNNISVLEITEISLPKIDEMKNLTKLWLKKNY